MANDDLALGPIDFVLLEFPDQEPTGEVAGALLDLVESGTIRLYDILAVRKDADGNVSGFEVGDLDGDGTLDFAAFAGARSGLLGDDDVTEAAGAMEAGTIAVLIVYENTWAAPFVSAALKHGGQMIASARIPVEDIIDALDLLEDSE
jgi:hypothetical protein